MNVVVACAFEDVAALKLSALAVGKHACVADRVAFGIGLAGHRNGCKRIGLAYQHKIVVGSIGSRERARHSERRCGKSQRCRLCAWSRTILGRDELIGESVGGERAAAPTYACILHCKNVACEVAVLGKQVAILAAYAYLEGIIPVHVFSSCCTRLKSVEHHLHISCAFVEVYLELNGVANINSIPAFHTQLQVLELHYKLAVGSFARNLVAYLGRGNTSNSASVEHTYKVVVRLAGKYLERIGD